MKFSLSTILIFCYVFVGLVPYFESVDKRYVHVLYLSILNTISLTYIIFNHKDGYFKELSNHLNQIPIFAFLIFFLWSLLSIVNTINVGEYIIQTNTYFQQLLSFLLIFYFIKKSKNFHVLLKVLIVSLTTVELLTSYVPYIIDIVNLGEPINRSLKYRGFTGSVNIISYTLLLKLPFFYYYSIQKNKLNITFTIYSLLIIYSIFYVFQTRSAMISTFLLTMLYFFFMAYNYYRSQRLSMINAMGRSAKSSLLPMVIALVLGTTFNTFFSENLGRERNVNQRLSSLNAEDYSLTSRFRFYKHAIETIIDKPIFGIGNGNWEIYSIEKDAKDIVGYTVPYHVHNDYLEISAESGIIGGVLYFSIIFYLLFLLLRSILRKISLNQDYSYEVVLAVAILSYMLDALFNFPSSRPYQQITLLFLLSVVMVHLKSEIYKINFRYHFIIVYVLLLVIPGSIYAATRVYLSSVEQSLLVRNYNFQITDIDLDELDTYEMNFPSVTATTIPLKAMKGFFYLKNGRIDESFDLFHSSRKYNPYLNFNNAWLSQAHYQKQNYDSSGYYSALAYNKIPNNIFHYAQVAQTYMKTRDSVALKNLFENHKNKTPNHEEFYLTAMATIINKDETGFVDNPDQLATSEMSMKALYTIQIGFENTMRAAELHALGEDAFKNKNYELAVAFFKHAGEINPFELPYRENTANAYMQLGSYYQALEILDKLINEEKTTSLRSYWMRGLINYELGKINEGCADLKIVNEGGWMENTNIYENLCPN